MLIFKKSGKRAKIVYEQEYRLDFDKFRESFKIENNAARFARTVSYSINPWTYVISPLGSYNIGFTSTLIDKCNELGIEYSIDQELNDIIHPNLYITKIKYVTNPKYQYRDYQLVLLAKMLKEGRGVILSPTRSGKSLVLAGLCHNVLLNSDKNDIKNILIVVPNLQLLEQMADDFENYMSEKTYNIQVTIKGGTQLCFTDNDKVLLDNNEEISPLKLKRGNIISNYGKVTKININETVITPMSWNVIKFGANEAKINKNVWKFQDINIIISNSQWLLLHGDELPYIDMMIIDECHGMSHGAEITKLVRNVEIPFKFGCTGTMPKSIEDQWSVIGTFGPVLKELSISELQEKKVLADVSIKPIEFVHDKKEDFKNQIFDINGNKVTDPFEVAQRIYQKESMFLSELTSTNSIIAKLAEGIIKQHPDWNVLILFDYIKQGNSLFNCLTWKNKFYIDGSVDVKDRKDIVKEMNAEDGGKITCANAKCFGTGITVNRIQCIFIVINGSAPTKIIQSIGRGLQRNIKNTLLIFDFHHNYKYSMKHFKEREDLYIKTYKKDLLELKQIHVQSDIQKL